MKHLYACLALAGLSFGARAQNQYVPLFRIGYTYQYTEANSPGDTTHTVRMAFPHVSFPDSVARLNGRAVALTRTTSPACYVTNVIRPDGLFGATVVIKNPGPPKEYTVRGYNGRTFVLKPLAALNQPWAATAAGLTAQVTARAAATTFGQPDQVATITLSDGETIRFSEKWGYLEGPSLGAYLNGQRRRHLVLTAITGQGLTLGQPAVGARAMFDYQPGDVFLRYSRDVSNAGGSICSESWTRDSVLTRTVSAAGDLNYTIWRRVLTRNYGSPTAPTPFCQNTPGATLAPGYSVSLSVPATDESQLALLTHTLGGTGTYNRPLTLAGVRTSSYNGRKTQQTLRRQVCQPVPAADSVLLTLIVDVGGGTTYGAGLGEVTSQQGGVYFDRSAALLGYRKVNLPTATGSETWGTLRTFANILKTADFRPAASTSVFPNPFTRELTVRFETQRPQPVTVQLRNALGQLVHAETRTVAAGVQQLPLTTPALPAGLYTLHLRHDDHTEVLKLTATGR